MPHLHLAVQFGECGCGHGHPEVTDECEVHKSPHAPTPGCGEVWPAVCTPNTCRSLTSAVVTLVLCWTKDLENFLPSKLSYKLVTFNYLFLMLRVVPAHTRSEGNVQELISSAHHRAWGSSSDLPSGLGADTFTAEPSRQPSDRFKAISVAVTLLWQF